MIRLVAIGSFFLALAACNSRGGGEGDVEIANDSAAATETANVAAGAGAALPPCPFRKTSDWKGSIEGGRLLVTGMVDLQMAGFKPQLTPRPGAAPGVLAYDLALIPAAGEPVNDKVRLEKPGTARHSAGEIYCGGERLVRFDIVNL